MRSMEMVYGFTLIRGLPFQGLSALSEDDRHPMRQAPEGSEQLPPSQIRGPFQGKAAGSGRRVGPYAG